MFTTIQSGEPHDVERRGTASRQPLALGASAVTLDSRSLRRMLRREGSTRLRACPTRRDGLCSRRSSCEARRAAARVRFVVTRRELGEKRARRRNATRPRQRRTRRPEIPDAAFCDVDVCCVPRCLERDLLHVHVVADHCAEHAAGDTTDHRALELVARSSPHRSPHRPRRQ